VELTLDVRHADDVVRADAVATLQGVSRPGIDVSWAPIHHHEATPVSPTLRAKLAAAIDGRSMELPSGAGHDAVTLSGLTDIAILFVRSTGGSHNPGEAVTEPDVALAIDAATRFACSI
jgi:allantoate deiminase